MAIIKAEQFGFVGELYMKGKDKMSEIQSTTDLFDMIQDSPEKFANTIKEGIVFEEPLTVARYLERLLEEHQMTIPDLIIKTLLSKSFVYQIFSGERNPGRDILLRIAFAMNLSVEETQHLFLVGQKGALYPKVRRDAALICCLEQKLSLDDADSFLESIGERGLL